MIHRFCPGCGVAPDNPHGCRIVSCEKCQYSWEVDNGKEVDMAGYIKEMQDRLVCPSPPTKKPDRLAQLREKYGSGVGCDDHADAIVKEACQLIEHVDDAGAVIIELLDMLEDELRNKGELFDSLKSDFEAQYDKVWGLMAEIKTLRRENETDHKLLIRVRDLWRDSCHARDGLQRRLYVDILERLKDDPQT